MLGFQQLDAYQCALELARGPKEIVERMPRGHAELADQFTRASMSIVLNIAEGAGKPSSKERARFNAIARGSAMECGAVLDLLQIHDLVERERGAAAAALVVRLAAC